MKRTIDQVASEVEFLKVQKVYHTSQCNKYQMSLNAKITGVMVFTYLGETDQADKIILEEPKADSAREIQTYVRQFANNMADYHHAKVLALSEQIDGLLAEKQQLILLATQGEGGSVSHGTTR